MKWLWGLVLVSTLGVAGAEPALVPIAHSASGLPGVFDLPVGSPRAVIVMVHGSGSHSRDEDLAAVTEGKAANPFFARLAQAFQQQGLACLRYDKRNYVFHDLKEPALAHMAEDPAGCLIDDCQSALDLARERFPGLPVYLLGHSQGTWVTLQVAHRDGHVDGLIEIGYSAASLETLVLEQTVYRPLGLFEALDHNHDRDLQADELSPELARQLPVLDLDQSGSLSQSEFQAGNWSNMVARPLIPDSWRRGEAACPDPNQVVAQLDCPILFLQGDWDNQTPSYGVKALQILEQQVWKKGNKRFHYFARAGHALDPRKSWDDLVFQVTPQKTIEECARLVREFFLPSQEP